MSHHDHSHDLPLFPHIDAGTPSRREFLKRSALLSAVAATGAPLALNLAAIGEAAAQTASDYKAIVCIFLNGGNDYANTLVPYDQSTYNAYRGLRENLAYTRDELTSTLLVPDGNGLPGGVQYALPPELLPLKRLFDERKHLAPVLNVGTLIEPTTKLQFNTKSVRIPPRIGSHNDQSSFWQSSLAEGATSGWGGRMGDLLASGNQKSIFTCMGVGGNAVFLSGRSISQYQIGAGGTLAVNAVKGGRLAGSQACSDLLRQIMTKTASAHLMEREYVRICERSIDSESVLTTALTGVDVPGFADAAENSLAAQLKMVARLIKASGTLGLRRQVFMVSLGGFDNHSDLKKLHPALLTKVGSAMASFYDATEAMGMAKNVVSFTASDFGRTLTSNSSGSDHGWGSTEFVMGGAVAGKNFIGKSPQFANNGDNDFGQGRLVPTTGVDQLAATLAKWFGLSDADIQMVLPNIVNFDKSAWNLGFMTA